MVDSKTKWFLMKSSLWIMASKAGAHQMEATEFSNKGISFDPKHSHFAYGYVSIRVCKCVEHCAWRKWKAIVKFVKCIINSQMIGKRKNGKISELISIVSLFTEMSYFNFLFEWFVRLGSIWDYVYSTDCNFYFQWNIGISMSWNAPKLLQNKTQKCQPRQKFGRLCVRNVMCMAPAK